MSDILVYSDEDGYRDRGRKLKAVPVEQVAASLQEFAAGIEKAFDGLVTTFKSTELVEVVISVEVTASGKVALLGSGAEAGARGGLQLKLKVRDTKGAQGKPVPSA